MSEFDQTKRNQVRQGLLDYMQRHGIGVPTLAKRIKDANPRKPNISIKTLQRFLAGEGRTFDMYVGFYDTFVVGQNVVDETAELGRLLQAFYPSAISQDYAGAYIEQKPLFDPKRFLISADRGFWRVTVKHGPEGGHRLLKGVLVDANGVGLLVLKDALTALPATYALHMRDGQLSGSWLSADFGDKDTGAIEISRAAQTGTILLAREVPRGL